MISTMMQNTTLIRIVVKVTVVDKVSIDVNGVKI